MSSHTMSSQLISAGRKTITAGIATLALVAGLSAPASAAQQQVTCGGVPATIVGTSGNDVLRGTPGDDVIAGLQGFDEIHGLGGNDILCGGTDRDIMYGGQGFDIMFGGPGPDLMYATESAIRFDDVRGARMFGGEGNDFMIGSNRWDRMQGGSGNDQIWGKNGRDWIRGGPDHDGIRGGGGQDDIYGGSGFDHIELEGPDVVRGGPSKKDRCEYISGEPTSVQSCEVAFNEAAEPYTLLPFS